MPAVHALAEFFVLLAGTVIHRPYVYGFFCCFLFFARQQWSWKKTGAYLAVAYLIAFICEYSSTRNGFPFGMYVYIDSTRNQELWLSNIPFWDSLSFVFLSYFSWNLAGAVRARGETDFDTAEVLGSWRTCLLAGFLMMLLDVVIDPLTLLGNHWFLGKIYYYPSGGPYFGVTLSNFAGWWFVGTITPWIFQKISRTNSRTTGGFRWGVFGVYAGVLAFNLAITAWIQEWRLFAASLLISALILGFCASRLAGRTQNAYA